jgi:hypothetical protein
LGWWRKAFEVSLRSPTALPVSAILFGLCADLSFIFSSFFYSVYFLLNGDEAAAFIWRWEEFDLISYSLFYFAIFDLNGRF